MRIYDYFTCLQSEKFPGAFRTVNDRFSAKLVFELRGKENCRLSEEAKQVVNANGFHFIQFPRFTYLRVGSFHEEPLRLPRFCLDNVVLMELLP